MKRAELLNLWRDNLAKADYHVTRMEVFQECGKVLEAHSELYSARGRLSLARYYLNEAAKCEE